MRRVIVITIITYTLLGAIIAGLVVVRPAFVEPLLAVFEGWSTFAFAYPWLLLSALPTLPLLLMALTRVKRRQVGTMMFTQGELLTGAAAPRSWRVYLNSWPPLWGALGVISLCLALARPQMVSEHAQDIEGIDIYVILDMSGSMQGIDMTMEEVEYLATRHLRPMNRFEIARVVLEGFVERRANQLWTDRLGMIIFGRHAFMQFPLTADYPTILWLLQQLELNDIDASATAIGNSLGQAIRGLMDSPADSRIILLITDGDERGGNISAVAAAQVARDLNIQIYPILVGREGPVLIPAGSSHFGFGQSYQSTEYPVDPELLSEVASISGGQYFRAEDREALETTLEEIIEEYEKHQFENVMVIENRDELYHYFVWAAFALIGLELFFRYVLIRKFP